MSMHTTAAELRPKRRVKFRVFVDVIVSVAVDDDFDDPATLSDEDHDLIFEAAHDALRSEATIEIA